jgi:hypothetical protein
MKPRPRRTAKHAALSALVDGLRAPMTNLIALNQTLASGRVGGAMIRDYRLMCAIEALRLTRLVETFLTNELQRSPSPFARRPHMVVCNITCGWQPISRLTISCSRKR